MYDYEVGMTQCQNEIRRLHGVCREKSEKIDRLGVLLYNAILYIADTSDHLCGCVGADQLGWFEETLGITAEEMSEIGLDWFDNLKGKEE